MAEEILKIEHDHFTLYVSSVNARTLYSKAKIRNSNIKNEGAYSFASGKLSIKDFEKNDSVLVADLNTYWPVFFENTTYIFEVEFISDFEPDGKPFIKHEVKEITDQFNYRKPRLYGSINFGNDIGKFKFNIKYSIKNISYDFVFEFEVFPIKLNYKSDYPKLIDSIQKAYPLLVLDFLKKTFSGSGIGQLTHPFIWWHIFQSIYNQLAKEANYVLNKPHNRLLNKSYFVKSEKLVYLSPSLEEEYFENKEDDNHYYQISKKELSTDTSENRFVKYALNKIYRDYSFIFAFINKNYENQLSDSIKLDYQGQLKKLTTFKNHPFWRGIGAFTGFKQESLAIQRKPGYSGFYRNYILLLQGIQFMQENKKLEYKNIAELYQIWCFIQLKEIIQDITGVEPEADFEEKFEAKHWSDLRLTEVFSCFKFKLANGDLLELLHDYSYKTSVNNKNNLRSYTEEQRPDITLRIFKKDLPAEAMHTFLFDAKYRIKTFIKDEYISDDAPPPDTLNQMHRYRDALFFKTKNYYDQAEKGVIGGYILFPGELSDLDTKSKYFYQSIDEVNVGAFPLNLNYDIKNNLLREFIETKVLNISSDSILKETTAQKYVSSSYPEGNVLIGGTKSDSAHQDFFKLGPEFYYFPMQDRKDLSGIKSLKYFSPWEKHKGCIWLYVISEVMIVERVNLFPESHPLYRNSNELYIKLNLSKQKFKLNNYIKSSSGNVFIRYATLNSFMKAKEFSDFVNTI